jgi:hypothetical protein
LAGSKKGGINSGPTILRQLFNKKIINMSKKETIPSRIIELPLELEKETVWRIGRMIKDKILAPAKLKSFLDGVENKHLKKEKARVKKEIAARELKYPILISREDSLRVWRDKQGVLEETGTDFPDYVYVKPSPDDQKKFGWVIVWINGLSGKDMSDRFPERVKISWPKRYGWYKESSKAGYFLVSLNNFMFNYSLEKEEEEISSDAWRMPANQVLEILLTLEILGRELFKHYLRTDSKDGHNKYFCIGKYSGGRKKPFRFVPFNGGKHHENIIPALIKRE